MLVAYILAFSPFNPPPLLSLPLSLVKGIKKLCPLCCLLSTLGLCVCVCVCSSSSSSKSSSPHCCLSSNLFFSVSLLFCACLGAEEEGECLGHRYQVPPAPDLCAAGRRAGGRSHVTDFTVTFNEEPVFTKHVRLGKKTENGTLPDRAFLCGAANKCQ